MEAEWHFFATSHGKSPCDGIGGTTKRLAARASLQSAADNQILTSQDFFLWAQNHISGIQYFWLSSGEIQNRNANFELEKRYALGKTISGMILGHIIAASLVLASPWKCFGCQMIAYSLSLMLLWINFKEKVIQMSVNA